MNALLVSSIVFGCVFAGAMLGLLLRWLLPQHHLTSETKDIVRLGMGLVGTMAALLLGLLVASAKGAYDNVSNELSQMSGKLLYLDRLLANYGPEAAGDREILRVQLSRAIDRMWPHESSQAPQLAPSRKAEGLFVRLHQLSPQTDPQRALKAQALGVATDLGQLRWLMYAQAGSSISMPFLVMMVFWLTVIFVSFGLFAPPNTTVVCTLFLCALSVSGAVFLVLELDHPFKGLIQISSSQLRNVVEQIGK